MSGAAARWADLRPRVMSAAVMVAVGAVAIWLGGAVFAAMVLAVTGAMVWELARMCAAGQGVALGLAGVTAAMVAASLWVPGAGLLLVVPALAAGMMLRRDRGLAAIYTLLIALAGFGLIVLRGESVLMILWLVVVVVTSDVMGYFAGRILGGPRFWPAISPKKTWSGTVAGWLGAMVVGLVFVVWAQAAWYLVLMSPLVAFAGQLGDIAESWLKRRAGVKDSSALIPGHGGFLDRFDALIFAVVAVLGLVAVLLPVGM